MRLDREKPPAGVRSFVEHLSFSSVTSTASAVHDGRATAGVGIFGLLYGLVNARFSEKTETSWARQAGLGLLYGVLIWVCNIKLVAEVLYPWAVDDTRPVPMLMHALFFGLPLALIYAASERRFHRVALDRSKGARPSGAHACSGARATRACRRPSGSDVHVLSEGGLESAARGVQAEERARAEVDRPHLAVGRAAEGGHHAARLAQGPRVGRAIAVGGEPEREQGAAHEVGHEVPAAQRRDALALVDDFDAAGVGGAPLSVASAGAPLPSATHTAIARVRVIRSSSGGS